MTRRPPRSPPFPYPPLSRPAVPRRPPLVLPQHPAGRDRQRVAAVELAVELLDQALGERGQDRKSTRLNSSHTNISYAVFCLKKKKKISAYTEIARGQQLLV